MCNSNTAFLCSSCISKALPFSQNFNNTSTSCITNNDRLKLLVQDLNSISDQILNDDIDSSDTSLQTSNCKYYECQDFYTMTKTSGPFSISAFHLNIASLNRHFDELNSLLALLHVKFSFIGISETRYYKSQALVSNFPISGYNVIHTPTESSAGGVALYISDSFSFQPRPDFDQTMYQSKTLESVFVEVSRPKKSNLIVGTIYKHPTMSVEEFNSDFLSPFLHKIGVENKQLLLLGDFNINLLNVTKDKNVSSFVDILGSNLILPQVTIPTRITEHSQTLIDNIFTSVSCLESLSGNILYSISDHLPQFCLFPDPKYKDRGNDRGYVKNWSKFDQESFILEFLEIDFQSILYSQDPSDSDQCFEIFNTVIQDLVNRHVPTVRVSRRQYKTQKKPWITPGILKSISKRDFFFRKFLKAKNPIFKSNFHKTFKCYRNMIVTLCRRSKSNYYTHYFNSYSHNMRKIWQGVREIVYLNATKSTSLPSIRFGNTISSDPLFIANSFNNFFTSVANSVRSNIGPSTKHFSDYLHNRNPHSIFLSPCTAQDISKIICSFSIRKSSGPNSIPVNLFKLLHRDISTPISFLVNLSFQTGKFPSLLKISKVIPIFKRGSSLEVFNYRPISLLSNIEKIFEKLMYSRLISFIDNHNIIFSRQFGFRKSHSTIHAVLDIVERIRKCLDKGDIACGIFVDLQKAFDTVDHSILLCKLKHYGIRGVALNWFQSYLSSRFQFTSVRNSDSELKSITHGVPQGSVLGPLLFLLYINDLHLAIKSCETFHFADDTHLLHFNSSLKSLCNKVNCDLKHLQTWLNANLIALNADKTEFILFRSERKLLDFKPFLKLTGKRIYPKPYVKYLGVYLDEHLNWNKHVSELSTKLQRANGAIAKLRHYVPLKVLIGVYYAIFNSHMSYACQLWGLTDTNVTHRVLTLQKAAVRLITFKGPYSSSSTIFANLQILNVFDLVKVLNILFVHQHLNFALPSDILESFNFDSIDHCYDTRGRELSLLVSSSARTTTFGLKSLSKLATSQWNAFQKLYPNIDISTLPYTRVKSLVIYHYLSNYC